MNGMEQVCFQIIAAAGAAKSAFIQAAEHARDGRYEDADVCIKEGEFMMIEAHKVHASLVQQEAAGRPVELSLLLVHAEDQMMGAEQFKVMAEQLIDVYKRLDQI